MSAHDWLEVFILFAGAVLAVLGWLISTKVTRIDADLDKLGDQLQIRKDKQIELELLIAKQHPTNQDIKEMMDQFRNYLDERFTHIEEIARGYAHGDKTGEYQNYRDKR